MNVLKISISYDSIVANIVHIVNNFFKHFSYYFHHHHQHARTRTHIHTLTHPRALVPLISLSSLCLSRRQKPPPLAGRIDVLLGTTLATEVFVIIYHCVRCSHGHTAVGAFDYHGQVVFFEPFHADVAFWHIDATVLFDVVFKSSHSFSP